MRDLSAARSAPAPASEPPPATPAASISSELLAKLRDEVSWRVDGGYDARDRIIERVVASVALPPELVAREVEAQLAAHAQAEATWRGLTDADKLARAFAALQGDGLLTRANFGQTQDDATEAIDQERAQAKAAGQHPRGWVYGRRNGRSANTR